MTGFHALHPDSITLCAETRRIEHKVNLSNETLPFVTILLADLAMQIKSGQWDGLYRQGNGEFVWIAVSMGCAPKTLMRI